MQHYIQLHKTLYNKRQHESRMTIKNLVKATQTWSLNRKQTLALLGFEEASLQKLGHWSDMAEDIMLTDEQIETASFLITLHTFLHKTLQRPQALREWFNTPLAENTPTAGKTPLEFLTTHPSKLIASRTLHQWLTKDTPSQ